MEKIKYQKNLKVMSRTQNQTLTKMNLSYLLMTSIFKRMGFLKLMQRNSDLVFRQLSITESK